MKKVYESPVFLAEAYSFSSSIASCDYSTDPNTPVPIKLGDNLCIVGDKGHKYSEKSLAYQKFHLSEATIFNDGTDNSACIFDWAGKGKPVAQTGQSFAQTFYGNNASEGNHAPGYNGAAFFS